MAPPNNTVTQARLKELLHYDPETGVFTWRANENLTDLVGREAGWIQKPSPQSGSQVSYRKIEIDGRTYYAHRLAVLYMKGRWPKAKVDHSSKDGLDNRWTNLREATTSQNRMNMNVRRDSRLGVKGVKPQDGRYVAHVVGKGKRRYVGMFGTPEEAKEARDEAADDRHGEFSSP